MSHQLSNEAPEAFAALCNRVESGSATTEELRVYVSDVYVCSPGEMHEAVERNLFARVAALEAELAEAATRAGRAERELTAILIERDIALGGEKRAEANATRAERVVAWLMEQRAKDVGLDIDGGDLQDKLLEVGYLVTVPIGFHKDCDSCEDGADDCIDVAPEFARLVVEEKDGE